MSEEKICTFESLRQQSDSQVRMMNFWFSLSVTDDSSVVMHSHSSLSSVGLCGPAAAPQRRGSDTVKRATAGLCRGLLPHDCIILTAAGSHTGRVTYFLQESITL